MYICSSVIIILYFVSNNMIMNWLYVYVSVYDVHLPRANGHKAGNSTDMHVSS